MWRSGPGACSKVEHLRGPSGVMNLLLAWGVGSLRFVLDIVRIFQGSFGGPTLFQNEAFVSPNAVRCLPPPFRARGCNPPFRCALLVLSAAQAN